MSTTPLGGHQLVEIGQAAPLTGIIPTGLSVEVIKVEKPEGGDDARLREPPYVGETGLSFQAYNRGKCGVTLDLHLSVCG